MDEPVDVVVVGAGLSGLIAARDLHRRGLRVVVLEAADRVGGRAMSETSALGSRLDLGGQWIGHDHHRLMELADELGITRFPMHTGLLPRVVDGPRRISPASPIMAVVGLALAALAVIRRIRPRARWRTTAVETWLSKVPGRTARRLLEVVALISWTADLDRYSVHAMTRMIGRQGGLRTILSTRGGAQEALLTEGAGTLAERLAGDLGPAVRTGHAVTSISRDDRGVTVRTTSREWRASAVIVTAPPPIAARITHEPPLPAERVTLESSTYMGSVYKAIAVYPRPFWRGRGGGELISLTAPGCAVFDTSPPDGPGHLCILSSGPEARDLDRLDATDRRRAVLGPLAEHLGAEVLEPASWHEKAWHLDEHVGGGYFAVPELGSTAGLPPVPATPVGPVHWAGTETASDHPGYLDGAIESGARAAREVIARLAARKSGEERDHDPETAR